MNILGALLVLFVATISLASCNTAPDIFLPPDADAVTIVGNGFSLQINQLNKIKDEWKNVATDAAQVEAPRDNKNNPDNTITNTNLYETTIQEAGGENKNHGSLDDDLLDWITTRATALAGKIERYESEIAALTSGERVVVQILLLNTLVDLDNLVKENIKELKWIKKKLRAINGRKGGHFQEVDDWVKEKIAENMQIEKKIKSTNKPTDKWLNNVVAIKRILREQRFSDDINNTIVGYLKGTFSMMERSTVFDLNRTNKNLNDGLYYVRARGRIPAHFPFSAQDAIVEGAQ